MNLQQAAGYQKLVEKLELFKLSFRFALFSNVLFNHIPVVSFTL